MRSNGFWISIGLVVIASTVLWHAAGGSERGAVLIFLVGAMIVFRAIARPVSDPFFPRLPPWQWALVFCAATGVVGAVVLSPARP